MGTVFLILNGMFLFLSSELECFIPGCSAKLTGERDRVTCRLLLLSVVGLAHHACLLGSIRRLLAPVAHWRRYALLRHV